MTANRGIEESWVRIHCINSCADILEKIKNPSLPTAMGKYQERLEDISLVGNQSSRKKTLNSNLLLPWAFCLFNFWEGEDGNRIFPGTKWTGKLSHYSALNVTLKHNCEREQSIWCWWREQKTRIWVGWELVVAGRFTCSCDR